MGHIIELFNHYGYIILFSALMLELIAFPIPGETLMMYSGFLVFQGKLNWALSILIASLGIISGITLSHFIGRTLGVPFFERYGPYFHMGPEKLNKTSKWFEQFGDRMLVVAYFIPGVRHITGYFSGITKVPVKKFSLYAYSGAIIWASTFITIGKILGPNWEKFHSSIKKYLIIAGIILFLVAVVIYLIKIYRNKIMDLLILYTNKAVIIFHSLGKVRLAVVFAVVSFLGFSALIIGLIQDYLANEFNQFDFIAALIVKLAFTDKWIYCMKIFELMTKPMVLIGLAVLMLLWIFMRGGQKSLEIRFSLIVIVGGEALGTVLRIIFHRLGPSGTALTEGIKYTFPSQQMLMAVAAYGFAAYMITRYVKRKWIGRISSIVAVIISIFTGLSVVFFNTQFPSDVIAGLAFGGIWVTLNIILLEVYKILPSI